MGWGGVHARDVYGCAILFLTLMGVNIFRCVYTQSTASNRGQAIDDLKATFCMTKIIRLFG